MATFRPPRLPQSLAALEPAFQAIYEDLQRLGSAPGDVSVKVKTHHASVWETTRVSPPPEGMGFVLPPPSAENRSAEIVAIIESPDGPLRVFVSPAGDGSTPTIDGEEMVSYSAAGAVRWVSNGADKWSESRGPAGATGATGATGAAGPAGADSAMRRLYKEVFYSDGSYEIYDGDDNLLDTDTLATWSPTSGGKTSGNRYHVWVCAGGPSGARGARSNSSGTGNGGSGGSAIGDDWFDLLTLTDYIASLGTDIPVTVGAGGAAVAGLSAAATNVAAASGNPGNLSAFGTLVVAYPGAPGIAGGTSSNGGGGGGLLTAGFAPNVNNARGGRPSPSPLTVAMLDGTDGGGSGGSSAVGGASIRGGGGGGSSGSGSSGAPLAGGISARGCGGSGGAGWGNSSGPFAAPGAAGGATGYTTGGTTSGGGGTAGAAGSAGVSATDGGDGADGIIGVRGGAGGGGGGGFFNNGAGTGTTGGGGDGGFPGGAGAPSGSAFYGGANTAAVAASGKGGEGCVAVFAYA